MVVKISPVPALVAHQNSNMLIGQIDAILPCVQSAH
jgi:hypothetical protein